MKKYIIVEESSNRKSIVGEMSFRENAEELSEFLNKISKVERILMQYYVYELIEDLLTSWGAIPSNLKNQDYAENTRHR